jgi:hypothetical protein
MVVGGRTCLNFLVRRPISRRDKITFDAPSLSGLLMRQRMCDSIALIDFGVE